MEDATKEFQIFMSPKRGENSRQSFQEISVSKQRMVPVISKLSPCTLFQTLTMNQKMTYKAVSGVSFQNSSHEPHKTKSDKSKNDKMKSEKNRRQSLAPPLPSPLSSLRPTDVLLAGGARRSRSLTSMESDYSSCLVDTTNKREIVYPCTPIILSSGVMNGHRNQYNRHGRRKRRSSSHARNITNTSNSSWDTKKKSDSPKKDDQLPVRPRRTRSTSSSREPKTLTIPPPSSTEDILSHVLPDENVRNERKFRKSSSKSDRKLPTYSSSIKQEDLRGMSDLKSNLIRSNNHDIDFNVNENDWQKYDILVSKQLNNILKEKEEPEGGYFSLEREEGAEEVEKGFSEGEYFQRENSNESIYVPQNFAETESIASKDTTKTTNGGAITIEDIYREVLFDSPSQQVGYVDDEGLYEEIYFERKSPPTAVVNCESKNVIVNSPINIVISPETSEPPTTPYRSKRRTRNSLSTIVHIGGKETTDVVTTVNCPSSSDGLESERSFIHNPRLNDYSASPKQSLWVVKDDNKTSNTSPSSLGSYQSPFIKMQPSECRSKSSSNLLERCSRMEACQLPDVTLKDIHLSIHEDSDNEINNQQNVKEKAAFFQRLLSNSNPSKGNSTAADNAKMDDPNPELLHQKRKTKSEPHLFCNSITNFTGVEYHTDVVRISCPLKSNQKRSPVASPPSFQGFLHNALFNPDTESLTDDLEDLVINDGQTVTCIMDSSSSSESDSSSSNLWLEVNNEFEFVAFKKEQSNKKEKSISKKSISKVHYEYVPLSISSGQQKLSLCKPVVSSFREGSEFYEIPERPSRRRKRCDFAMINKSNC